MKKVTVAKGSPAKKKSAKTGDEGELRKATKLKPLKEKERKGWKNKIGDDDDFMMDDEELKFDNNFEDGFEDSDDEFYDDEY